LAFIRALKACPERSEGRRLGHDTRSKERFSARNIPAPQHQVTSITPITPPRD